MPNDLLATRAALRNGATSPLRELERSLTAANAPACQHAFTRLMPDAARAQAARAGIENVPLGGLAVSVKDLFDIAGQPTAAASRALSQAPAAPTDSTAVARLRAAGASLIGRTNMVEFAFSGVGINPHFGTPAAWDYLHGPIVGAPRIPGGSSSGAAVSVATGAAFAALGSDTGGSIRIPAALNGLVGFKGTAALVPTDGALPLSATLDTACAITRSVRDAALLHEVLAARTVTRSTAPLPRWRLAAPGKYFLEGLEPAVQKAFSRTLSALRRAGAVIDDIDLPAMDDLGALAALGSFSAAESYAWHRSLLERAGDQYDPRVRSRIERGASMSACDYLDLQRLRKAWISRMAHALAPYDALLSPTLPIQGPEIASLAPGADRDAEFFRVNNLLLRNTSAINMLDGCALSLPCHEPGELPMGLMVWHGAWHDDAVLAVSEHIEQTLQKQ